MLILEGQFESVQEFYFLILKANIMQKTNKTIGIVGYRSNDDKTYGAGVNHLEYLATFGNPRILMPWEEVANVDMLYLPGGLDLSPQSYGEVPGYATSDQDVFKQFFYEKRLRGYIDAGIPVFGVCLGFQQLAAFFGCKLTQDLKYHVNSSDRWEVAHEITIVKTKKKIKVNSHHHQGLRVLHTNQQELRILATFANRGDGELVEAFEHLHLPIVGVQWHPKFFGAC